MRAFASGLCLALTLGATAALAWTEPTSVTWTLSNSVGALISGSAATGTVSASGMTIQYAWDRPAQVAAGNFQGSTYSGMYPPFLEMLWDNQTPTQLHVAVAPAVPPGVYRVVASYYTDVTTVLLDQYLDGTRAIDLVIPGGTRAEFYVSMGPPAAPCNTTVTVTYGEVNPVAATASTWGAVKSLYDH